MLEALWLGVFMSEIHPAGTPAFHSSNPTNPSSHAGERYLTAAAALIVGAGFFALWFWLLPGWLGFHLAARDVAPWRWLAAIPSIIGFSVAMRCVWDFGWTGHGTPAPFIPPQRLVVVGFYRYVRNPMYTGLIAGWLGLWVVFGRVSTEAVIEFAAGILAINLFVILYEERALRAKFDGDYDEYRRHVPRWIPRLRPWQPTF